MTLLSVYFSRTGFQRRMQDLAPYSKDMNCRNHRLSLAFVHLLPKYQELREVDGTILALWKLMNYSSAYSAIFQGAQQSDGKKVQKIPKAAATRWLSHGEASARLVSCFKPVLHALDAFLKIIPQNH